MIFLSHPHEKNNAMHGDIVLVRVSSQSSGARREGSVVRILERGITEIVGTYTESKYFGFVIPDDKNSGAMFLSRKMQMQEQLRTHQVVVHLRSYPDGIKMQREKVVRILDNKKYDTVNKYHYYPVIHKHCLPQSIS